MPVYTSLVKKKIDSLVHDCQSSVHAARPIIATYGLMQQNLSHFTPGLGIAPSRTGQELALHVATAKLGLHHWHVRFPMWSLAWYPRHTLFPGVVR